MNENAMKMNESADVGTEFHDGTNTSSVVENITERKRKRYSFTRSFSVSNLQHLASREFLQDHRIHSYFLFFKFLNLRLF